ncbi:glutamate synthase (NADPH/NADH) small chain [Pustulibacterium marinum]|uniref:Glutamate synthase (NADPH/NADH) small chain n=1 Tax=Pustulibacterium marinum TaxID=1224947 RepID=A0A1I7F465_9FLAO|nr:glutamate synthase subunit beta [Pustulibacterium marinum]SFU30949.1 glutamate synthase (NADPH/NADH) small chain [Pustulibacterium marinum]
MATQTDGFLKYKRENAKAEAPENRVQHYNEFYKPFEPKAEKEQTARCMDCGVPFCHFKCPLENNIPDFNKAAFEDRWDDAYNILLKTNPFPEFTGRICPAPCEQGCVLGINSDAVTIEEIEKTIAEKAFEKNLVQPNTPEKYIGVKVAVIGSGPAGMAAAHFLNGYGFNVTIIEKDQEAGGLLRYGIPDFKLEKQFIERRVEVMKASGVEFRMNTEVGKDITLEELENEFETIILALGAQEHRKYDEDISNINGVYYAMDYLAEANRFVSDEDTNRTIDVKDKHVIVIGGGDTGSDCIGTANRDGAQSVTQLDYHERPPIKRSDKTPWPMDALKYAESTSHQEGCNRIFKSYAKEFHVDQNNNLISVTITEVNVGRDAKGRRTKEVVPNTTRTVPCDALFIAIGFTGPSNARYFTEKVSLERKPFNLKDYATNNPKYFISGDARTGQSLVVNAIAEGRDTAKQIKAMFTL